MRLTSSVILLTVSLSFIIFFANASEEIVKPAEQHPTADTAVQKPAAKDEQTAAAIETKTGITKVENNEDQSSSIGGQGNRGSMQALSSGAIAGAIAGSGTTFAFGTDKKKAVGVGAVFGGAMGLATSLYMKHTEPTNVAEAKATTTKTETKTEKQEASAVGLFTPSEKVDVATAEELAIYGKCASSFKSAIAKCPAHEKSILRLYSNAYSNAIQVSGEGFVEKHFPNIWIKASAEHNKLFRAAKLRAEAVVASECSSTECQSAAVDEKITQDGCVELVLKGEEDVKKSGLAGRWVQLVESYLDLPDNIFKGGSKYVGAAVAACLEYFTDKKSLNEMAKASLLKAETKGGEEVFNKLKVAINELPIFYRHPPHHLRTAEAACTEQP